ncbi:MAG: SEC-C metal-binding domain-containing protein [Planctomycetota bacterium]
MQVYREVAEDDKGRDVQFRFDADGRQRTYLLLDSHCEDPICEACSTLVTLVPGHGEADRISFWTQLDGEPSSFDEPPTAEAEAIAAEFIADPGTQHLLAQRKQIVRAWGLSRWENGPGKPAQDWMYSLRDFSPTDESFLIPFMSQNEEWFTLDQYCVNPTCACADCTLSFYKLSPGRRKSRIEFTAAVDLHTTAARSQEGGALTGGEQRKLEDLHATFEDWRAIFGLRRKLIRRIARRQLDFSPRDKTPNAPKVGRNQPCPCGSGRKHKKCCGVGN